MEKEGEEICRLRAALHAGKKAPDGAWLGLRPEGMPEPGRNLGSGSQAASSSS